MHDKPLQSWDPLYNAHLYCALIQFLCIPTPHWQPHSPHYNPTLLNLYLPSEELIGKDARSSFVTCVSIYYAQLEIAASSTSCKQSMMKRRKSLSAWTNIRKQLIAKNNLGAKEQQFIETRLALKQSL